MSTATKSTSLLKFALVFGTLIMVFVGAWAGFKGVYFVENALIQIFYERISFEYPQIQIIVGFINLALGGILLFFLARSSFRSLMLIKQQPVKMHVPRLFINAFLIGVLISMCLWGVLILVINLFERIQ